MIPKAEREKDKAALAALPSYIEIDEDGSIWDCPGQGAHVARVGDASDADIRPALAHAVNRLPVYMEDAEWMVLRCARIQSEIDRLKSDAKSRSAEGLSTVCEYASIGALSWALSVLKGEI